MRSSVAAALLLIGVAYPASAERTVSPVTEVVTVTSQRGAVRYLFRTGPTERFADVAVSRASLRWVGGEGDRARTTIQVHLMDAPWSQGSVGWASTESLDPEVYVRQEVALGEPREIRLDVTRLFKEVVEQGGRANGFVLTVDPTEGDGLTAEAASALSELSGATLELEYRKNPPLPRSE